MEIMLLMLFGGVFVGGAIKSAKNQDEKSIGNCMREDFCNRLNKPSLLDKIYDLATGQNKKEK